MSGPLLDRIDLQIRVPAVRPAELSLDSAEEGSAPIRERVEAARARQRRRLQPHPGLYANAHLGPREIRRYCRLGPDGEELLRLAITRLGLSARGYHRLLKVARTIADLAAEEQIGLGHLSEAIQYRTLDRARGGVTVQAAT